MPSWCLSLAVFTALVVGALVILAAGGDPLAAYFGLFEGAFGSLKAFSETTVWATPYIFAGLAVAFAFKGGLFNIGAEGQLAFGAVAAAWVGYALPGVLGVSLAGRDTHSTGRWRGDVGRRYLGLDPRLAQSAHRRARSHQYDYDELHRPEHHQFSAQRADEGPQSAQRGGPHPRHCRERPHPPHLPRFPLPLGFHLGVAGRRPGVVDSVEDDSGVRDSHGRRQSQRGSLRRHQRGAYHYHHHDAVRACWPDWPVPSR